MAMAKVYRMDLHLELTQQGILFSTPIQKL